MGIGIKTWGSHNLILFKLQKEAIKIMLKEMVRNNNRPVFQQLPYVNSMPLPSLIKLTLKQKQTNRYRNQKTTNKQHKEENKFLPALRLMKSVIILSK